MKTLLYTATVLLTCIMSVPVVLAVSSVDAKAAETPCPAAIGSVTTGTGIHQQLAAIATCDSAMPKFSDRAASSDNVKSLSIPLTVDSTCPAAVGSVTTGFAIRHQLAAIAACNSAMPQASDRAASMDNVKSLPSTMSSSNANEAISAPDNFAPAYCQSFLGGLQPGNFGYQEGLSRCLFGA